MAYSHARREEIARALGYRSYAEARRAPAAERATRRARLEARGEIAKGAVRRQRSAERRARAQPRDERRRRIPLGNDREIVRSTRDAEIKAAFRRAEESGERVKLLITVRDPQTGEPVEILIGAKGGYDAAYLAAQADAEGGLNAVIGEAGKVGGGKYSTLLAANLLDGADILGVQILVGVE